MAAMRVARASVVMSAERVCCSSPASAAGSSFLAAGRSNGGVFGGRTGAMGFLQIGGMRRTTRRFQVLAAARRLFTELRKMKDEADAGPVEFESPLSIVLYPDPKLRARNIRISVFDERLQKLVEEMLVVMYRTDGVGLSAPQIGVNARLMVFNPAGEKGKGKEYVFVNPTIVKYGKQKDVYKEGCLSFLSIEADVERPTSIRIDAQDINGKKFGATFKGWTARIFQHEYDHLEAVLYTDRMTPEAISTIEQDLLKLEEEYEKRTEKPRAETIKDRLLRPVAS